MNSKTSLFAEYFNWIFKKYQSLQQHTLAATETFRIADIKQNKNGEYTLQVQIIGKATFFECTPHEIVTNDHLLEGFSKKDIRAITFYATQKIKKPKYKILVQEFCENINKIVFKLGKQDSNEQINKTADEISLDKEMISKLNSEDAHLIGFTTAAETALREKAEMEKLRERHKKE